MDDEEEEADIEVKDVEDEAILEVPEVEEVGGDSDSTFDFLQDAKLMNGGERLCVCSGGDDDVERFLQSVEMSSLWIFGSSLFCSV